MKPKIFIRALGAVFAIGFCSPPLGAQTQNSFPLKVYSPLPAVLRSSFPERFRPHPSLMPMVEFWRNVYANYDLHHTILHDTENLGLVYGVLNFDGVTDTRRRVRIEADKKSQLRAMLLGFDRGDLPATEGEKHIFGLFAEIRGKDKFKEAAGRIRGQWGQKSRFQEGIIRSGRYMPMIEKIFAAQKVPVEIARLVFVESMFVPRARSKVGAAGPWQFMPRTARLNGLVINDVIDERHDPLIAAQGAARLLYKDFEELKSWPLAINAYNTGALRMVRAVRHLHTKRISVIIRHFRDRGYQFASRNFYPEFLAAWEAVQNHPRYFGKLERQEPVPFDELPLAHPTSPYALAQKSGTDVEVLKDLNPAYHDPIFHGGGLIPQGYVIRVPQGQRELFASLAKDIHQTEAIARRYVVRPGDTLSKIASRHRVSLTQLMIHNSLAGHRIHPGQSLKIPGAPRTVMLGE